MEQGQSLSVVITPSVAGTPDQSSPFVVANIHDGNGKLINFEPSSPGQSTVLQSAPASQSGIWMLETAAISGFGNYHVQMYLNAAVEEETVLGSTNNGIATAQSIDGSELLLPGGGRRLA
ncbi:MAG: hypothetical protein NT069_25420, partial [Planctomycetota bacterium]|nr:hypothetical protein [Planctomycetota bacterium]